MQRSIKAKTGDETGLPPPLFTRRPKLSPRLINDDRHCSHQMQGLCAQVIGRSIADELDQHRGKLPSRFSLLPRVYPAEVCKPPRGQKYRQQPKVRIRQGPLGSIAGDDRITNHGEIWLAQMKEERGRELE